MILSINNYDRCIDIIWTSINIIPLQEDYLKYGNDKYVKRINLLWQQVIFVDNTSVNTFAIKIRCQGFYTVSFC